MGRFIEGEERGQHSLLPSALDDFVDQDKPVRVVDAFIGELDLGALGFTGVLPAMTGRPSPPPRRCSSSISTAISTACNRAGAWRRRRGAMSR